MFTKLVYKNVSTNNYCLFRAITFQGSKICQKKSHKYFLKGKMQKKLLLCAQVSDIKLNYKKCLLETDAKLINATFLSNQFYTLYNTTFIISYLDAILDET